LATVASAVGLTFFDGGAVLDAQLDTPARLGSVALDQGVAASGSETIVAFGGHTWLTLEGHLGGVCMWLGMSILDRCVWMCTCLHQFSGCVVGLWLRHGLGRAPGFVHGDIVDGHRVLSLDGLVHGGVARLFHRFVDHSRILLDALGGSGSVVMDTGFVQRGFVVRTRHIGAGGSTPRIDFDVVSVDRSIVASRTLDDARAAQERNKQTVW
jgi:hypothetical protein